MFTVMTNSRWSRSSGPAIWSTCRSGNAKRTCQQAGEQADQDCISIEKASKVFHAVAASAFGGHSGIYF
jgi:hypothetical protein